MNKINSLKNIKLGKPSVKQIIFWAVIGLIAIGGFFFIRGMVTCWTITPLPGQPPSNCGTLSGGLTAPTLNEQGTPIAPGEQASNSTAIEQHPRQQPATRLGWRQPHHSPVDWSRLS